MNLHIALPSGPVLIAVEDEHIHEHEGIKFFVHVSAGPTAIARGKFRASEFSTGRALPLTEADDVGLVVQLSQALIDRVGSAKINAAMAESPVLPDHRGLFPRAHQNQKMKTTIDISVIVRPEGQPIQTYTQHCESTNADVKSVWPATITGLEIIMSKMHRVYFPTAEEAAADAASPDGVAPAALPPTTPGDDAIATGGSE